MAKTGWSQDQIVKYMGIKIWKLKRGIKIWKLKSLTQLWWSRVAHGLVQPDTGVACAAVYELRLRGGLLLVTKNAFHYPVCLKAWLDDLFWLHIQQTWACFLVNQLGLIQAWLLGPILVPLPTDWWASRNWNNKLCGTLQNWASPLWVWTRLTLTLLGTW